MKPIVLLLATLGPILLLCGYGDNPYDPNKSGYRGQPVFTIDIDNSTIAEAGDTTNADTIVFILNGNDRDHRNQFRYSIDGGDWSDWDGDKQETYAIRFPGLESGVHSIRIEVCYHPDNDDLYDSTITFFQARKPDIVGITGILVDADARAPCTLWVNAEGTGELLYAWYRNGERIDSATSDTLIIENVSIDDTAVIWNCSVTSEWGDITSNDIQLRVLFHVKYDGNNHSDGEVPEDTTSYESGDVATALGNTGELLRGGYTFVGWNTKDDGNGTAVDTGDLFQFETDNITLYAEWQANPSFTLAYDRNGATGGTVPDSTRQYKRGEPVTVCNNSGTLVKTGYTFTGWNTKADGSGTDYDTSTTFSMVGEYLKLFAKWEIIQYTINFDSRGGSEIEQQTVNHGSKLSEPDDPVWSGYTFLGWYRDSLYTTSWVFANNVTSDMTLYARWVVRDADGNIYTTVTIGNQVWLVENLKTTRYNDSITIPPITDSTTWAGLTSPAFCWYDNDSDNKNTYGALYNWYAIKTGKLAPKGWHVATDAEWDTLISILGGKNEAGGTLKEIGTDHWNSPNTGATNASGFYALPGGYRRTDGIDIGIIIIKGLSGDFISMGTTGSWWSSTDSTSASAWYRSLSSANQAVGRGIANKKQGHSVRCVRNTLSIITIIPIIPVIQELP